ncbi:MAG: L-2-amino-thiazoline-4-carboxylic acid hydrolase [Butyrivibrio sp.]|nr:L-2-amino-thiazoline-4-carboxylic acid hydrolase [Butyrivibrio sp.]
MKEKELAFNNKKRLPYSKTVKKVMLKHLTAAYGTDGAEELWERIQGTYVDFLKDMPFIGGRKNTQAGGVYDSIALFAYYEAVPVKPDFEEMSIMNRETFVPAMQAMGFLDMNWSWVLRLQHFIFRSIAKRAKKHEREWAGNYHMEVRPYDREKGIYYEFTSCPIAEFAKRHGYADLMPAFCNADYPMLGAMHGGLIRKSTCAHGSHCDYWIVGDQSGYLKKHPAKTDSKGYVYNE